MAYFQSKEVKIYFDQSGRGEAVIFLHGFSIDRRMWRPQVEFFNSDYQIITPDARGHGKSDAPATGYAREDRTDDLKNLADFLQIKKFHLVGLSMGGGDALSFAIDYPERLYSLTLAGTVVAGWKVPNEFRDIGAIAREFGIDEARRQWIESSLTNYKKRRPELERFLESMMLEFSGELWLDPKKGRYPKRNEIELASIVYLPVQIIIGQHDIFFRLLSEQLHELMPDSRLDVVTGVGHMVNLEAPDEFNHILSSFLRKTDPTSGNS
jgi:pimeloyl-ACP methyl ester carboxylesterase